VRWRHPVLVLHRGERMTAAKGSARPSAIELCAGAGGQALGLVQAGFTLVDLIEQDPHACATLTANARRLHLPTGTTVTPQDVRGYVPRSRRDRPIDLLAGGIPCPPFSVAGRQLGPDDERDLFPEVLRLARVLRPRALMIENVQGLMSQRFRRYREEIEDELTSAGLHVAHWDVVEASGFGVAQRRPRSILVALRKSLIRHFTAPSPKTRKTTVASALKPHLRHWRGVHRWAEGAQSVAPTLVGGSRRHGGADLGPTGAKAAWERLGVNGHLLADEPPARNHTGLLTLTVEHAAILQGFPPSWRFEGGKTARYRQVGNAFPPPVARAFATAIRASLEP